MIPQSRSSLPGCISTTLGLRSLPSPLLHIEELRDLRPLPDRVEFLVRANQEAHTVAYHNGQVCFGNHPPDDLAFLAALDADTGDTCVSLYQALIRPAWMPDPALVDPLRQALLRGNAIRLWAFAVSWGHAPATLTFWDEYLSWKTACGTTLTGTNRYGAYINYRDLRCECDRCLAWLRTHRETIAAIPGAPTRRQKPRSRAVDAALAALQPACFTLVC
jgi:hypothetical protein